MSDAWFRLNGRRGRRPSGRPYIPSTTPGVETSTCQLSVRCSLVEPRPHQPLIHGHTKLVNHHCHGLKNLDKDAIIFLNSSVSPHKYCGGSGHPKVPCPTMGSRLHTFCSALAKAHLTNPCGLVAFVQSPRQRAARQRDNITKSLLLQRVRKESTVWQIRKKAKVC